MISLGLYIALIPIIPVVQFWWQQRSGITIPYSGALADASDNVDKQNKPTPKENRLVIPTLSLDEEVKEGSSLSVIENSGLWRRPNSSNNPMDGNMVVVGHRFTYTQPYGSFYHLDKLKKDDTFALYWEGKEYVYKVKEISVVEVTSVKIEQNTTKPQLTLYTCTPIWSAKQRLVVKAERLETL